MTEEPHKYLDPAIKELNRLREISPDWGDCKKLRHKIQKKNGEVQKSLDDLCKNVKDLNILLKELFHTAPKKDVNNYLASPLSPNFIWVYIKNDLFKKGLTQVGYVNDSHKKPDFTDAVNEAIRWLFKLEKKLQGPEAQIAMEEELKIKRMKKDLENLNGNN